MPVKSYHPDYLDAALESLMHQTSGAWRLQIVTEADREPELRARIAHHLKDPRVRLTPNEGRKLAGALNTGMRAAKTEFVAILLGDDMWARAAVEVLTREISEPSRSRLLPLLAEDRRRARGAAQLRAPEPVRRATRALRRRLTGQASPVLA